MSMINFSSLLTTKIKDVPTWAAKNLTKPNVQYTGTTFIDNYKKSYALPWPIIHFMGGWTCLMYTLSWKKEYAHYKHERHERIYGKGHH